MQEAMNNYKESKFVLQASVLNLFMTKMMQNEQT